MPAQPIAKVKLRDVLDVSSRRTENVRLPPEYFSVLTQVRKSIALDEDLALSIYQQGQISCGMAAVLTPAHARTYVREVNLIYGSAHTLNNLTPIVFDDELCYLVIFAGHRRHAHVAHVCARIQNGTYAMPDNAHFDCLYRATLHFDIGAEEAIELQFNENRYTAPPLHEEAEAAWRLFRYKQKKEPKLAISAFARTIGRSADWVSNALRFCRLPSSIQSYVNGDNPANVTIPYGVLVDLARLGENYESITGQVMGESAMHQWILEALASRLSASAFAKKVSNYLADKRAEAEGQISLFAEEQLPAARDAHIRRVVAQEMVRGLWLALHYAKTVQKLRVAGVLRGKSYLGPYLSAEEQEWFSPRSPVRIWTELLGVVNGLTLDLAEISRNEKLGYLRKLVRGHPLAEEAYLAVSFFAAAEEAALGASH